jgi:hypothetical protein
MATTFTTAHGQTVTRGLTTRSATKKVARRGLVVQFFYDLLEDILQKPLQAAKFAKHDMFREHINAMSISYFALILLLILASLPLLAYSVQYLVQY